ncbi:NAD-dependent epimerase [Enterococcus gallinarum]|nr:NAD-dependent epimerase/dehydratase family protein [Enterococcus gallinarum]KIL83556.1 NAD-dependent epimerase [Enterococcus gallinarum]
MKRILITGANSYIGTSFENWMNENNSFYRIDKISVRNTDWRDVDFSQYDCIIHLAAIVHKNEKNIQIYNQINRDLTVEIAKKAKQEKVNQFIYFSTMAVFGKKIGIIDKKTKLNPTTHYGKSKYEAELLLRELEDKNFIVSIVRPPMIYGKGCPGNYDKLAKIAKKITFFPKINNQRSMIYIDNLNNFLFLLFKYKLSGTFHPQNSSYVSTVEMVSEIAKVHGNNIYLVTSLNFLVKNLCKHFSGFGKIFGDLKYSYDLDGSPGTDYRDIRLEYDYINFNKSIYQTEK